jgi:hypothetical protein
MATITNLGPEDEQKLYSICAHEAGHFVVALHFRLNPRAYIGGPRSGICKHTPGVAWQNACIAWAGFIAVAMLAGELSAANFYDWLNATLYSGGMDKLRMVSAPDVAAIEAEDARSRDIARAAFKILDANRDLLKEVAANLVEQSRTRFAKNEGNFALAESLCLSLQ